MENFERLIKLALKRNSGELLGPDVLEKVPGSHVGIGETGHFDSQWFSNEHKLLKLGLPDWDFSLTRKIPLEDESTAFIHCYHFLEHLTGEDAIAFMYEVERVLAFAGVFQFAVPLHGTQLANQDLTHKSFWTEDTFRILFDNKFYDPTVGQTRRVSRLYVRSIFIAGVAERNLMVMGQIQKV